VGQLLAAIDVAPRREGDRINPPEARITALVAIVVEPTRREHKVPSLFEHDGVDVVDGWIGGPLRGESFKFSLRDYRTANSGYGRARGD
jgi:hypothetical protein